MWAKRLGDVVGVRIVDTRKSAARLGSNALRMS
jgi:hypothetical protein